MVKKRKTEPAKKRSSPRHRRFISIPLVPQVPSNLFCRHILDQQILNMIESEEPRQVCINFFKIQLKKLLKKYNQTRSAENPQFKLLPSVNITTERQFFYIALKVREENEIWQDFYDFLDQNLQSNIGQRKFQNVKEKQKFNQHNLKLFRYLNELNKPDFTQSNIRQAFKLCFLLGKTMKKEYRMYLLSKKKKLALTKKAEIREKNDD